MLLVVPGLVLLGVAAGIALATYKVRRMRRIVAAARPRGVAIPDEQRVRGVAGVAFRLRFVLFVATLLAGSVLTVMGLTWG